VAPSGRAREGSGRLEGAGRPAGGRGRGSGGRDVVAVEEAPPLGGPEEPGEDPEQRRLAGTVGTDQPDDGAARDLEVDLADGHEATEFHSDACARQAGAP